MPTYQPGIPTGTVFLDIDYQNIQDNFTVLNDVYSVDHVALTASSKVGYHQSVHLVSQSTTATNPPDNYPPAPPATVANTGQIFSSSVNDGYNTGTALFFLTGGGSVRQLTSNFDPLAAANGYTFLPGGLVMQWGVFTTSNGMAGEQTAIITFATSNRDFAKNCFVVNLTLISQKNAVDGPTSSSSNSLFIVRDSVSKTGFRAKYNGPASAFNGFFWTAIGN